MKIETFQAEHLSAVAKLEQICFPEPWSEKALKLLLSDTAAGAVCICDGNAVAYGSVLWAPDEGQILNLAVHPHYRRRGLGRAVLRELINMAVAHNCMSLSLEVRVSNDAAVSLYREEGFSVAGRRKHFYRNPTEDAFVMIRTLKDPDPSY